MIGTTSFQHVNVLYCCNNCNALTDCETETTQNVSLTYDESSFCFKDFDYYLRKRLCIPDDIVLSYSALQPRPNTVHPTLNQNTVGDDVIMNSIEMEDTEVLPTPALLKALVGPLRVKNLDSYSPARQALSRQSSAPQANEGLRQRKHAHIPVLDSGVTPIRVDNYIRRTPTAMADEAHEDDNTPARCPRTNDKTTMALDMKNALDAHETETSILASMATNAKVSSEEVMKPNLFPVHSVRESGKTSKPINAPPTFRFYGQETSWNLALVAQVIPCALIVMLASLLAPRVARSLAEGADPIMQHLHIYINQVISDTQKQITSSDIRTISLDDWRTLLMDAYATFVCRAVTELFIRRMMNPENDLFRVSKQFSLDSVFAGLSAAAFLFLRRIVLSNLK